MKKLYKFGNTVYRLDKIISISKNEWEVDGLTEYSGYKDEPDYSQVGHIYIEKSNGETDDFMYEKDGREKFTEYDEYMKDYRKIYNAWSQYLNEE